MDRVSSPRDSAEHEVMPELEALPSAPSLMVTQSVVTWGSPSDRLPAANPVNHAHRGVLIAAAGQDEFDRLNPDREISVLNGTLVAAVSVN